MADVRFWHKADITTASLPIRPATMPFRSLGVRAMRRRDFIAALGTAAAWPHRARAQDAGRTYRLGMMFPFPREARESVGIVDALMDELRRNGFVEGKNLVVEYRAWAAHLDLI